MIKTTIPERTEQSKQGLIDFCNYINTFYPTKKLSILEIGSWTGCSMEIFAQRFEKVYCVDPWYPTKEINTEYDMTEVENIFDKRMKNYNNVIKLKMTSENAIKKIDRVSIVYIDGLHNYEDCKKDIDLWITKCGLFISGHDYWKYKFDGVIKAVNERIGIPDKIFSDTSWIKRR